MKKRLSLLILSLFAFQLAMVAQPVSPYSDSWKKIENLESKGQTLSAQKEAQAIFIKANADKQPAEQIKALMFVMKYRVWIEEDPLFTNYYFTDSLARASVAPVSNILKSLQASLCMAYLRQNRYQLYGRTKLEQEDEKDIRTWSLQKLIQTSNQLFDQSLQQADILKKNQLTEWEPILQKGNTRIIRPTLYDFLAHQALEHYLNDETRTITPGADWKIQDERAFSPVATFVQIPFSTTDSSSHSFKAIRLLQDILAFHLQDKDANALFDADLIRLSFVHKNGQFPNKEKRYEESLQSLEKSLGRNPLTAEAMFLRASLYADKGRRYQPLSSTGSQFELSRAVALCDSARQLYPESEGAKQAILLAQELRKPTLTIETESVNIPGQPFRGLVQYKNIDRLYFRIIKTNRSTIQQLNYKSYKDQWTELKKLPFEKNGNIRLPNLNDLQTHSVEIKLDALTTGTYILVASQYPEFDLSDNIMCRQVIYVSNIGYFRNNLEEFFVVNRETGMPLHDASVTLWESKYNYNSGKKEEKVVKQYTTDKNGKIVFPKEKQYRPYQVQIKWKQDELFTQELVYNEYDHDDENPVADIQTFFFTDRSIYRPGQKLFFKGILIEKNARNTDNKLVLHKPTLVQLLDANEQIISSLSLVSNEFGSFSGTFDLPINGLTGQFSIRDTITKSQQYFRIEEYKRPRFLVDLALPTGTYRLNDSVQVKGKAMAFAGNSIDGATVRYRVIRHLRFQPWIYYGRDSRRIHPGLVDVEIANGSLRTSSDGSFTVVFKALPDEESNKDWQPIFDYTVMADVTDINGETRSGSRIVSVAYQALQIDIDTEQHISADSITNIRVRSTNTNKLFEKAWVTIKAIQLKSPGRYIRKRLWDRPDQFLMSQEEFISNFPHDPYAGEDQVKNWPEAETMWTSSDSTNENGSFRIPSQQLRDGWYKLVAMSTDQYGEKVQSEMIICIRSGVSLVTDDVELTIKTKTVQPGQTANYTYQAGLGDVYLFQIIEGAEKRKESKISFLQQGKASLFSFPVNELDRGNLNLSYFFIRYNRVYEGNNTIIVPWDNKELNISLETFRDKLLPGSRESWSLTIKGQQADKKAAELLLNMYDQSLDQFSNHQWNTLSTLWPINQPGINWSAYNFNSSGSNMYNGYTEAGITLHPKIYDSWIMDNWMGFAGLMGRANGLNEVVVSAVGYKNKGSLDTKERRKADQASAPTEEEKESDDMNEPIPTKPGGNNDEPVSVRKNFQETAFFYPDLRTDSLGSIRFSFTMPEALTQWKFMAMAHDQNLASGYLAKSVITQKPLMVQPNAPRFVREADRFSLPVKVVNLSDKEINGTVQLELMDAGSNAPVDGWFKNIFPVQHFSLEPGQSLSMPFPIEIPASFSGALTWRAKAISNDRSFSDGEESTIPVLSKRLLVTETMPIGLRNQTTASYSFKKLINPGSQSLVNHTLTVEYTSNPAWYAVQSLPYLMEFPHECAEQQFNRYFSNTLAASIANRYPRIKQIFEQWKNLDSTALQSNLEKNEELKTALLQETPWVLDAQSESRQKKQIALLFDLNRLATQQQKTWQQLSDMQLENGAFCWFSKGPENRYITNYIVSGFGHLQRLGAIDSNETAIAEPLIKKALAYLDARIVDDYRQLLRSKANMKKNQLSALAVYYLYMRSFYNNKPVPSQALKAYQFYRKQAATFWLSTEKNMQAMIALSLHRTGDRKKAALIVRSLKENAITHDELGMYWRDLSKSGYYWNQSPLENQALMIEAFTEIDPNPVTIDNLKTWLLKQKQTRHWGTTKATAEACYALLLSGSDWLIDQSTTIITIGNKTISSDQEKTEAGTGYLKKTFSADQINPSMGQVTITRSGEAKRAVSSWGAVYWQYFEDLDKITASASPLLLEKKWFLQVNTTAGPQLQEIKEGQELHIGDKVIARVVIRSDRDMEFLHLKDMRGACMEPVNVISEYKYQGGLGYYESTRDAVTHFFFDFLPRGTHVLEYPTFITHTGVFTGGISQIQCMYAPEFSSHSQGMTIEVAETTGL